ncbi:MAG: flagellar hook-basal body protein [Oligoflexia bacterium]|nr:flagellar hook-basal body protein [Oligoflexia bacterium]
MERGSYTAASGGFYQMRKLEVVNNNLANVNTAGFKKQMLVGDVQTFDQTLASAVAKNDPYAKKDHERSPGVMNVRTATDFTPGPIKNTGNPLDAALRHPNDFFVVETADGEQYTRAGNFTLNEGGDLVTQDGSRVLGDGGPISVNGANVTITPDGGVRANGNAAGRLRVVRFEDPSTLERTGDTRFKLGAGQAAPTQVDAEVEPEALEMSNVTAVSSMIDLITANRAFDMYTRSARSIDEMNQMAIGQVGRRRG